MKRIFAAALFVGLVCAAAANAATVTGVYYGTLTSSSDPAFPYLSVGDTYRTEFSYDTSTPDADPDSQFGLYIGAVSANIVFSNGFSLSLSGGNFYVGNDVEAGDSDYLNFGHQAVVTSTNFPTGLYTIRSASWTLIDYDRSALSSDQLPASYLNTALFDEGRFGIGFDGIGRPGVSLGGTLTSTPVPAALPLFASALGGFGLLAWRRQRT